MYTEIVILNNLGIESLEIDEYDNAVEFLKRAIQETAKCGFLLDPREKLNNVATAFTVHQHPQEQQLPYYDTNFAFQVSPPSSSSSLYLHSQGISLVLEAGAYSTDERLNSAVISMIVIYNLALAVHLSAIIDEDEIEERQLSDAKMFYLKLLSMFDVSVLAHPMANFVVLAALNNLGYAAFQMADFGVSRVCSQLLSQFVCWPVSWADVLEPDMVRILDMHRTQFLRNASSLLYPLHAPVA